MSNESLNKISLRKETINKISLKKKELTNLKARIFLVLDTSQSMKLDFDRGKVQEILERVLPLAMQFDDDGELELSIFSNYAKMLPNVSVDNFQNFTNDKIIPNSYWEGTSYSPVIRLISSKIFKEYYNTPVVNEDPDRVKMNIFQKIYAKFFTKKIFEDKNINLDDYKSSIYLKQDNKGRVPVYVLFLTDGENDDQEKTRKAIIESSYLPIFWQFIGIGAGSNFRFLNELDTMQGRYIDNANFLNLNNIEKINDEELYEQLLQEFPLWINKAKDNNII